MDAKNDSFTLTGDDALWQNAELPLRGNDEADLRDFSQIIVTRLGPWLRVSLDEDLTR